MDMDDDDCPQQQAETTYLWLLRAGQMLGFQAALMFALVLYYRRLVWVDPITMAGSYQNIWLFR